MAFICYWWDVCVVNMVSKIWSAGQGVPCSGVFCQLRYVPMGTQNPEQGVRGAFRLRCAWSIMPLDKAWGTTMFSHQQLKRLFSRMAVKNAIDDLCNPNTWHRDSCRGFVIVLCPDSNLQYIPVMFGHWKCSCMYMNSMWQKLLLSEVTDDSFALAQEACLMYLLVSFKMANVR